MIWLFERWSYWIGRSAMVLCPSCQAHIDKGAFCDACWARLDPAMRARVSVAWRSEKWRAVLKEAAQTLTPTA